MNRMSTNDKSNQEILKRYIMNDSWSKCENIQNSHTFSEKPEQPQVGVSLNVIKNWLLYF